MSRALATGFPTLDRQLDGGMTRGALIVLGGDAGIGSSAMAMGIALGAAAGGARTVFLSSESREEGLLARATSQLSGAPIQSVEADRPDDDHVAAIASARARLLELPIRLAMAPSDLTEDLQQAAGVDWELLVIDGLEGLILDTVGRQQILAGWVTRLKRMAVAHGGAVLVTTRTVPALAEREDPRPRLADFGADGTIRSEADLVLGLYREEHYRPDRGVIGAAELLILKNRRGPRLAIDLWFESGCRRFEDLG
ncbi:MAG TPA: DnaB-like helicase C-terminal domain-containing protein [Gemmatimonadales bacterium]|nr:DnaB-like helicase C-terminal domain-containing protein [Gemmatimonadales bacterium]